MNSISISDSFRTFCLHSLLHAFRILNVYCSFPEWYKSCPVNELPTTKLAADRCQLAIGNWQRAAASPASLALSCSLELAAGSCQLKASGRHWQLAAAC